MDFKSLYIAEVERSHLARERGGAAREREPTLVVAAAARELDQVIEELSKLVTVELKDRKRFRKLLEESKSFESLPIRTRLTDAEVARFAAQRFRFPGVEIKARLFRNYPYGELASHVIGYIGRITQKDKTNIEDWPDEDQANYRGTEYIGKLGVEQNFEQRALMKLPSVPVLIAGSVAGVELPIEQRLEQWAIMKIPSLPLHEVAPFYGGITAGHKLFFEKDASR